MSKSFDRYNRRVEKQIDGMLANLDAVETGQMVKAIDAKLMFAKRSETNASQHRLDAAHMYFVLRKRIEGEGRNWWKWHKDQFARSRRDAEKLLAIGNSPNPALAAAKEIERNRQDKRDQRKREAASDSQTQQSNVVSMSVTRVVRMISKLADHERRELWSTIKEKWHGEIEQQNADRDEVQSRGSTASH